MGGIEKLLIVLVIAVVFSVVAFITVSVLAVGAAFPAGKPAAALAT
jgi:hypothetical protein